MKSLRARSGFSLVEMLIAIAIAVILTIIVVALLNPPQLIQQGRDSARTTSLGSLNNALGAYYSAMIDAPSGLSLGTANVMYISIPDPLASTTLGDQCQGLSGLPTLEGNWTYHCVSSTNLKNIDGTGWVPVNFKAPSVGSSIANLPVDPTNDATARLFFTYVTNGYQYELTSAMESKKFKLGGLNDAISPDAGKLATLYEKGSQLGLEPYDYGDASLVGYWPLDEGVGTTTYDYSGTGNMGSASGTTWSGTGKVRSNSLQFYGGGFMPNGQGLPSYVSLGSSNTLDPAKFTINAWVSLATSTWNTNEIFSNTRNCCGVYNGIELEIQGTTPTILFWNGSEGGLHSTGIPLNVWTMITATYDGSLVSIYLNGSLWTSTTTTLGVGSPATFDSYIGALGYGPTNYSFYGLLSDIRLYSRAINASETKALYLGGR